MNTTIRKHREHPPRILGGLLLAAGLGLPPSIGEAAKYCATDANGSEGCFPTMEACEAHRRRCLRGGTECPPSKCPTRCYEVLSSGEGRQRAADRMFQNAADVADTVRNMNRGGPSLRALNRENRQRDRAAVGRGLNEERERRGALRRQLEAEGGPPTLPQPKRDRRADSMAGVSGSLRDLESMAPPRPRPVQRDARTEAYCMSRYWPQGAPAECAGYPVCTGLRCDQRFQDFKAQLRKVLDAARVDEFLKSGQPAEEWEYREQWDQMRELQQDSRRRETMEANAAAARREAGELLPQVRELRREIIDAGQEPDPELEEALRQAEQLDLRPPGASP